MNGTDVANQGSEKHRLLLHSNILAFSRQWNWLEKIRSGQNNGEKWQQQQQQQGRVCVCVKALCCTYGEETKNKGGGGRKEISMPSQSQGSECVQGKAQTYVCKKSASIWKHHWQCACLKIWGKREKTGQNNSVRKHSYRAMQQLLDLVEFCKASACLFV